MSKSSKKQTYEDEIKLLNILQQNSSDSIEKIAEKCGFTRQKLWRIKSRLEKNKTIWGYTAVIDESKQDMTHYTMLIKRTMKPLPDNMVDTICVNQVGGLKQDYSVIIEDTYHANGDYDWIVTFKAKDIIHAKKFSEFFNNNFGEYIKELKILETLFFIRKQGIVNPQCLKLKDYL